MLKNIKYELRHFLLISFMFIGMVLDLYFTDRLTKLDYKDIGVFIIVLTLFVHGVKKFIFLPKNKNLQKHL